MTSATRTPAAAFRRADAARKRAEERLAVVARMTAERERTRLHTELARLDASLRRLAYLRYLYARCPRADYRARAAIAREGKRLKGRIVYIFGDLWATTSSERATK